MIIIGAFSSEKEVKKYASQLSKDGYPSFIIEHSKNSIDAVEKRKTTKELYDEVMRLGLNGEERKQFLGERYEEVQKYINKKH